MNCLECGMDEIHARGLCDECYGLAKRQHALSEYPTDAYLKNPEAHIRWAFEHYPRLVGDVSYEFPGVIDL